jgi:hypothetical protein
MNLPSNRTTNHQTTRKLLPWYVNGTLQGEELTEVETHLDSCDPCNRELQQQRLLGHALRTSEEMAFSAERAFSKLRAQIVLESHENLEIENRAGGLWERLRHSIGRTATPVRWVLAAQLILIVSLGAFLVNERTAVPERADDFWTLTEAVPPTSKEQLARVVFEEGASEGDIRSLLVESDSRIVHGPSPFGVYTLEIAGEEIVDRLRASPLVVFAEPLVRAEGMTTP